MNLLDTPLCQVPFGEYLKVERTVGITVQFGYAITAGILGVIFTKLYQRYHAKKMKAAIPALVADPPGPPCTVPA